jgi:hypothetical protein
MASSRDEETPGSPEYLFHLQHELERLREEKLRLLR